MGKCLALKLFVVYSIFLSDLDANACIVLYMRHHCAHICVHEFVIV